jgi:hypothetical protein
MCEVPNSLSGGDGENHAKSKEENLYYFEEQDLIDA